MRAFADALIERRSRLMRYARSLTRNDSDAEDLVQDTYLKAWRYRHLYVEDRGFTAWLTTILYNTFINECGKLRRRRELAGRLRENPVPDLDYHEGEDRVFARELGEAFRGHHFAGTLDTAALGLSEREIRRAFDIPTGTVKSRRNHMRERVRKLAGAA